MIQSRHSPMIWTCLICVRIPKYQESSWISIDCQTEGYPSILRFKVWPILLKSHPFVISPFIQPDSELLNESTSSRSNSSSSSSTGSNTPLLTAPGSIKDAAIIDGDANDNDNDSK